MDQEKLTEIQELLVPVMEWLEANTHPHVTIIVDSGRCEIVEGLAMIQKNLHLDCPVLNN
jgi:hypothetical protein